MIFIGEAIASGEGKRYLARSRLIAGAVGASPSGKASVFGIDIPRFESWRPSHSMPAIPFWPRYHLRPATLPLEPQPRNFIFARIGSSRAR